MGAAPDGYAHPADACAITVTGGTEGVDYYYENVDYVREHPANGNPAASTGPLTSHLKKLVICSDTPLTLSTSSTPTDGTIWIAPGTQADLTFDNVSIESDVPVHIERNRNADGATVSPETSLHITLKDNSTNTLQGTPGGYSPGIHCGEGTHLVIDDAVRNVDTSGNPITPQDGRIPAGTTFVDNEGIQRTAAHNSYDSLTLLETKEVGGKTAGSLTVRAGHQAAGIGSTSFENSGDMTFNGGVIDTKGFVVNGSSDDDDHYGVGAGIGSGEGGGGTYTTINGGRITAQGAYHGAAIGTGLAAWYNTSWWGRKQAYLFQDSIDSGRVESNASAPDSQLSTGTIRINGGWINAIAPVHGNAIGHGCATDNRNGAIIISGGTILPDSSKSAANFVDIGGRNGYVVITGGSVQTVEDGSKFENKDAYGYAYGSFSHNDDGSLVVDESDDNKVFMITIDLGSEIAKRNNEAGITDSNLDERITDWNLKVGGADYPYGAPARFSNGKLFLWLPKTATEKEITVNLSYTDKNGAVQKIEPLFRDPDTGQGGTTLKRYIDFELPEDYLAKLTKYYDGTPFGAFELSKQDPPLTGLVTDSSGNRVSDGKKLTDESAVSYKYQLYDKRGGTPLGTESEIVDEMPSNVGVMKFTMDSTQYATPGSEFAVSYWGHRATGWWEIKPTTSSVEIVEAKWVNGQAGSVQHPSDMELAVTARINHGEKDPDGKANKDSCKPPEGRVQLYMDGKKVGEPIEILFEDKTAAPITRALENDPIRAASRAVTQPGQKNADRIVNGNGGGHTLFTYTFKPSDADFLVPDATTDGKHVVSVQYLPPAEGSTAPANYLESVNPAGDPEEAPKADVAIEPIDPKTDIGAAGEPGADPTLPPPSATLDPDPTPDDPDADPTKPGDKTYEGDIATTWDKPTDDNPHPGRVTLTIKTDSSGPISIVGEDGSLFDADFIRDEKTGEPVRNPDGTYTIVLDPKAVGEGKLTIQQKPNGAYTGTTWDLDVTVGANPKIAPAPKLAKKAENLTHSDGPTQPGDRIRYTVEASNGAAGSAWTQVLITDPLPACMVLDEATVKLDNPRDDLASKPLERAAAVTAADTGKFSLSDPGAGSRRTLAVPAGTVWGESSATLTFECTVAAGLDFSDADSVDLGNVASAAGKRPNPDGPAGPDVDLDPDPGAKPGEGPTPSTPPAYPAGPETVAPADPGTGAIETDKAVENLTDPAAKVTRSGDKLRYTITLKNKGAADSCLLNAVIADPLPTGMEPVADSMKLTVGDRKIAVDDSAYDRASRTIAVTAGDLWGGQSAVLVFDVIVGKEAVGADNTNVAFAHGTVPSVGPDSIPTNPEPGHPTTPPADEPVASTPSAEPPILIGDDPADGDVTVAKTAENTTSADGKTRVGDIVRYRIVLANEGPATAWMDAVIRDDVPAGLEPVSESIRMTLDDGTEIAVPDSAYDDRTRRLSVAAGHLYGGHEVVLAFDAVVTEEAVGADIGNVAAALGTLPSQWDPDGTHPAAGEPFDPPAGWEAFDRVSEKVESPAAYPPGTNEKGGVIPAEGDPDEGTTIRAKRLAQTGDELAAGFALGAGAALAAALALLLALRRLRRAR
ncbi:hypothetical protein [Adlercreutzia muris]|uniref:hypothetical protein n=1 Tax=Adlercreutzia muris TaxID=1796610 RepID=UPI0023EBA9C3|nr:hypothetical protein [Adlercreutzia muris]